MVTNYHPRISQPRWTCIKRQVEQVRCPERLKRPSLTHLLQLVAGRLATRPLLKPTTHSVITSTHNEIRYHHRRCIPPFCGPHFRHPDPLRVRGRSRGPRVLCELHFIRRQVHHNDRLWTAERGRPFRACHLGTGDQESRQRHRRYRCAEGIRHWNLRWFSSQSS